MKKRALPQTAEEFQSIVTVVRRLVKEQGLRHWKTYIIAFVLMGIGATCTALSAVLLGRVINEAYIGRSFPGVVTVGILTAVLFMTKGLANYGHSVLLARIGNRIVAANQRRLFDKLLNESLGFFADRHSTEFINRLTAGANAVSQILNMLVTAIGRDVLSLIGLLIVMVVQDPVMSLISLIVAPPALFMLRKLVRRIYNIARAQFHGGTQIVETLQESLQGMRTVKAFTMEDAMRERFNRNVAVVETEANNMARVANRASPLMETLGGIAIAAAIVYSGYRVIVSGATPGEFFSFITAFLLAYEPAKRLAKLNIELSGAMVGVRVLFEILDKPASEPVDDHLPPLKVTAGRIDLNGVEFAYRSEEPILRGTTLTAEPGKLTALVGPSGGGKSTIFNLLMRFHDAQGGMVAIDGQDVQTVSRRSLRGQIAYVGQDVFLFRGNIRDNIAFGKHDATDDDIAAAAKAACAHEFISAFPNGYNTSVGEHGLQLSGGQRQRISIARALIKNAPIILLDEATAALDSESEIKVREAMDHLCQGRTTLAIAHRLHTISHADRIHVIEQGTVVESGGHSELLKLDRRYASFYRLQLQHHRAEPLDMPAPAA